MSVRHATAASPNGISTAQWDETHVIDGVFDVLDYGAVGDGVTDDTAAIQAALDAALAAGGTMFLPAGIYRCNSALIFGNTAGYQKPVRIIGAGMTHDPASGGGTILDLRYTGGGQNLPKIQTRGLGLLALEGLTLWDGGSSSNPFLKTTRTTLHARGCAFIGNPAKSTITCDQDAILLGGTGAQADDTLDSWFQGYGTIIEACQFHRIRRAVYGRAMANSVIVRGNRIWTTCGTDLAAGAAIEFDPGGGANFARQNVIVENLIEVVGYIHGVKLIDASANFIIGNGFWDGGGSYVSDVLCSGSAVDNLIIGATLDDDVGGNVAMVSGAGILQWLVATARFKGTVTGGTPLEAEGVNGQVEPIFAAKKHDGRRYVYVDAAGVLRADDEVAHGTALLADFAHNTAGNGAVRAYNRFGRGGAILGWPTGAIAIVGTDGNVKLFVDGGAGSPESVIDMPQGSLWLRSDGDAATSIYVKTTPAGQTTGWVAK